jgi:hypothetical protein
MSVRQSLDDLFASVAYDSPSFARKSSVILIEVDTSTEPQWVFHSVALASFSTHLIEYFLPGVGVQAARRSLLAPRESAGAPIQIQK